MGRKKGERRTGRKEENDGNIVGKKEGAFHEWGKNRITVT